MNNNYPQLLARSTVISLLCVSTTQADNLTVGLEKELHMAQTYEMDKHCYLDSAQSYQSAIDIFNQLRTTYPNADISHNSIPSLPALQKKKQTLLQQANARKEALNTRFVELKREDFRALYSEWMRYKEENCDASVRQTMQQIMNLLSDNQGEVEPYVEVMLLVEIYAEYRRLAKPELEKSMQALKLAAELAHRDIDLRSRDDSYTMILGEYLKRNKIELAIELADKKHFPAEKVRSYFDIAVYFSGKNNEKSRHYLNKAYDALVLVEEGHDWADNESVTLLDSLKESLDEQEKTTE